MSVYAGQVCNFFITLKTFCCTRISKTRFEIFNVNSVSGWGNKKVASLKIGKKNYKRCVVDAHDMEYKCCD